MSRLILLAATLLGLWLPGRALAWNSVGHLAIAKRAYDQLSDGQKAQAFAWLKEHPHYKEFLAKGRPENVSEPEWVFVRAAFWPDWVRPRKNDTRGQRVLRYHRPDDHYINIPFALDATPRLNRDKNDVVSAVRQRLGELASKDAAAEDKAIALCWFLHLVGDIHQPLHCVSLYCADFPTGDLGGNLFWVKTNGKVTRLHFYWDDLLGADDDLFNDSDEHQAKVYRVAIEAAESLRDPKYGRDKLPDMRKRDQSFQTWSREGFELAKLISYAGGSLPVTKGGRNNDPPADAMALTDKYDQAARALARERAAIAGYRLADRLKPLLTPPQP